MSTITDPENILYLRNVFDVADGVCRVTEHTTNLASVTNARLAMTRFEYDPNDNLVLVRDALDGVVRFGYDPEDNRTTVTDPNDNLTRLDFDLDGLLIAVHEAGGQNSPAGVTREEPTTTTRMVWGA